MATVVLQDGRIELPREVLGAAGIRDGQELAVEVSGPGTLQITVAGAVPAEEAPLSQEEYERRLATVMAANPRLFSQASDEERARTPRATDADRERVGRALSKGGRSLVDDILEEREAGW